MELKKANLHMDQVKCQINTQITLEEDKNISERNPDVAGILMEKGRIIIDDIRPGMDSVAMKGKMVYEVLYVSEEEDGRLYRIQGEIPWEEKVRMEGMENMDLPQIQANIEDLRSSLINSRKINVRALVNFCILAKEIKDEEILLDIESSKNIEMRKEPYSQSVMAVDKKDVFRIKEDLELPSSLPPVGEVLWKTLDLGKWEVRPLEESIGIQGELKLFILYESSEEEREIRAYETTIPFSGNLECHGCSSDMVTDITPGINYENISIKQDYDGEERVVEVEMLLDIPIQLYEIKEMEQVTDIYGTSMEVIPEYQEGNCKFIHPKFQGRVKLVENIGLLPSQGKILQICHVNALAFIEEIRIEKEEVAVEGVISVTVLYLTDHEKRKYETIRKEVPFTYYINRTEFPADTKWKVVPMVIQSSGVILDENQIEVKITVDLEILAVEQKNQKLISDVRIHEFSEDMLCRTPGIVVYIPEKKETLWDVGKKYYVSQKSIKEINQLKGNEVAKGEKIILVKENC